MHLPEARFSWALILALLIARGRTALRPRPGRD